MPLRHLKSHPPAADTSDEALDGLASAVHSAAHWLPPWPDPMTLVIAAGFELVVCPPGISVTGTRRVGFEWDADPQVRGLRVLRAFAAVLLREILGVVAPDAATVTRLAGRLLIPGDMLAAARRDPCQPARNAPRAFVAAQARAIAPTHSGAFSIKAVRR